MRHLTVKSAAISIVLLVGLVTPSVSRATSVVLSGWDLLQTQPGTTFAGAAFQGVPLVTFNFAGGSQNVGNTDTIVHRLAPAGGPSESIPIELAALQLQSVNPIDLGFGLDNYYITLQSMRGGPQSIGNMTINFGPEGNPHGTFDSFFDVFFDVRIGSLSGPIVLTDLLSLTSTGTLWSHEPSPGALLIDGVNFNLNGIDIDNDFHPSTIHETHPSGAVHNAAPASVPDAGATLTLGLIAIGCLALEEWRRKLTQKDEIA